MAFTAINKLKGSADKSPIKSGRIGHSTSLAEEDPRRAMALACYQKEKHRRPKAAEWAEWLAEAEELARNK